MLAVLGVAGGWGFVLQSACCCGGSGYRWWHERAIPVDNSRSRRTHEHGSLRHEGRPAASLRSQQCPTYVPKGQLVHAAPPSSLCRNLPSNHWRVVRFTSVATETRCVRARSGQEPAAPGGINHTLKLRVPNLAVHTQPTAVPASRNNAPACSDIARNDIIWQCLQ